MTSLRNSLKSLRDREMYRPSWKGVFLNSFFFIKHGIHRAVRRHAHRMNGTVIDFGCGQKPYRDLLPATLYVGLDVTASGHPAHQKRPDLIFDGLNLPIRNGMADAVIATEVFEHVFRLDRALEEIYRVLKPGGTLLLTCPFCWPEHEEPYDYARYSRFALKDILTRAGFVVDRQEKEGPFAHVLPQMALCFAVRHLRPSQPIVRDIVGVIYNSLMTPVGLLLGVLLPKRWDLYLCNVAVAIKPSDGSPSQAKSVG